VALFVLTKADTVLYNRAKDAGTDVGAWFEDLMSSDPWYKDVVPNVRPNPSGERWESCKINSIPQFRLLEKHELPAGCDTGSRFTSVCINTAIYLPWLAGQCLKNDVKIKRGVVSHVTDAATLHQSGRKADIVINCTGLNARKLGGVQDLKVYPARGQIVVVRNEPGIPGIMASVSGTDDGPDEATYIMNRAAGGGCILGGCLQKNNWESQPDPNLAIRIMKRCVAAVPELTGGKGIEALSVVRHGVGLRPMREGGPRVEKERLGDVWVVHQYGHGGYGYQSSYGSAFAALKLVDEIMGAKAKLWLTVRFRECL
jgi:D-amino-acid oxidase